MAECNDKKCPKHANVKIRGTALQGVVVSDKMQNSVVVERKFLKKLPKYERYRRETSRITAHKPACMEVNVGDTVEIAETKKLSKTKSFVVTKVIKKVE